MGCPVNGLAEADRLARVDCKEAAIMVLADIVASCGAEISQRGTGWFIQQDLFAIRSCA